MLNYDFLTLSPNEFENISRDLLQKKLNSFIESFTTGRDGGIDFRYTTEKARNVIIQSKRYKDYKSLYTHLKKEVQKVKRLKPDKYILTTSVGLTPKNKTEIQKLFSPYLKVTEDILGRDDLNNLLGLHKDVENKYYKLWLTSTNILEKILHNRIYNQSIFEVDEIKEQVKLYVQNESFNEALSILKKHHYIIISGIPGIGKTTLARIIVLFLLSSEFEEFIYLIDNIDDGYTSFKDGKKQIFFFDDFLGKIRFDAKNSQNIDNKIVKFIEKIKKSSDKILIFTTREYILSQARNTFEAFNLNNIEIAKCILDLSSYTKIIKAQIIYNHLFFANIPQKHLENLIENKNYLKLVNHKNYNPRIIETIINRKIWEHCPSNDFAKAFKSFFDNPESVWKYAFENSLDKFSQYTLFVLLTMGTPVLIQNLELAIKEFLIKNNYKYFIAFDSITFNRAIRELENTFITTQKDSYDGITIEFQNPSIQDFLINYLKDKSDLITSLIETSIFVEQFFNIFTTNSKADYILNKFIKISTEQEDVIINRIKEIYLKLKASRIFKLTQSNSDKFTWYIDSSFKYSFLKDIYTELGEKNVDAREFVYQKFQESILIDEYSYMEKLAYISLLRILDLNKFLFNEQEIIDNFLKNINYIDDFSLFNDFESIFPIAYSGAICHNLFKIKVSEVINDEIERIDNSDINDLISKIESIESKFTITLTNEIEKLTEKNVEHDELDKFVESQIESYLRERTDPDESKKLSDSEETEAINQIFNSLINS